MEEFDFDGKLDFSEMEEYDFDGKLDFSKMDQIDEDNRLELTEESDISQELDIDTNADNNDDQSCSLEEGKEIYENLNSESTSTVLISENSEEECNELEKSDQGNKEIEEIDQNELEREIEKELEEGVEGINQYLEEEAEFINAYQEMVGIERELDEERAHEGEERYKTEEEWEKEIENSAYIAEQLYGSMKEIESDTYNEEVSEIDEELGIEKEAEQREEIIEPQLSDLKEETSEIYEESDEERDQIEQHQAEPFIEEALKTEPESIIDEKEIEHLQELDLEEQFQKVLFNEYIEELVEKQNEEKNQLHDKIEQEQENIEQNQEVLPQLTYLQEKLDEQEQDFELEYEEKDEIEQHQVEVAIDEELETDSKSIINEEELEYVKNFEPENQLDAELLYDLIEELAKKQKEEKAELEEKEEYEDLTSEERVAQVMRELEIDQEISSGEPEAEYYDQERDLKQDTISQDEEVIEQFEIEERTDHQQELEEILEQNSKIEQEAINEIEPREEQKNEETWKWTLKNWIVQATEIDSELKSELKKLVEKYNELEKLIKKYTQLYNKAKSEELSQAEKKELKSLNQALQKLNVIKIELFLGIREMKHYLDVQYYYDFWDKPRVNQKISYFFTHLSQKYSSLKQLQKKKNNTEKALKNWIEDVSEEEINSKLKAELKKLIENYKELEAVAIMFMKLYNSSQKEILSNTEQKEYKTLIRTLQKIDPSKIELFTKIRAIKHYLNDKNSDDLSNKKRVNQILSRFLKKPLQKYKKLDLYKIELLNMCKIHSEIIKKLKHDFKQEKNSKELSLSKLANLVKGLSLAQFKKLNSTTKSLRYATYLEFYYFIKQAYENNNIDHEKWREMKKLFKIVIEITTNNTKSIPSQYELENFFFQSYIEPTWELWNSLEWEKYQNSHVLLKRYWCRYCNHIAKILIEYCQKFSNIPFKAYILKDGESKWREIQERSKIHILDMSNLEKNLSEQLNIDLEKDIIEIRLLNKKYQYRYILENSKSFFNAKEFLGDITTNISNFIRNNLVKKNIELQVKNNLERVNLIKGNRITQYSLSLLMEEDKEYIRKVIKQNLRYNEHYIINFACLKKVSKNIALIFEENESDIEEINNAIKKIKGIIKNYIEKNKRFFLAKNQIIIQNHPNIILNYFNKIFNEEISIVERIEAAYWLGFIFADGYITINARNKKSSNEFGINLSIQDKSQLIKFCSAIGANPTFIRNVITSEKDGKSYFASIFRIYNEKFCKILKNHGIVRKKSKIIELPEQFKILKKNNDDLKKIFLSFLLGYYDGDGIVNRNTIISGSKKFLKQINNVLLNAFGANLNSKIDERTKGNYYLNIERKIKQNMENVFQNSLERKRRYAKGKYSENIDPLILKLIIQNLNELPISEMIKIYNDLIEKKSLPKYLKLSANNLKRNIALIGYKNHHKEWYINRNLNLRLNKITFKKKLIELLEKIK